MSSTIGNAKNTPLNVKTGTIPNMGDALRDWFQFMVFGVVQKILLGFQVVEVAVPTAFIGVIQPFTDRRLQLLPEGQRAWSWFTVHSDPVLRLQVDDVIVYRCKRYRVMSRINHTIYNYIEYSIVEDWTNSGPSLLMYDLDGGNASTVYCDEFEIDGGDAFTTVYALPDIDGGPA